MDGFFTFIAEKIIYKFLEFFVLSMKIIGAIDIGSNANRMICARLTPDRRIELVESVRTPLRLGLDVFKFGYLQEVTIKNLVEPIEISERTLSQNNCEEIIAYETSALREADIADEVILRIEALDGSKSEKRKLDSITIVPVLQSLYAYELATSFRRERLIHCALVKKRDSGLIGLASSLRDKSFRLAKFRMTV